MESKVCPECHIICESEFCRFCGRRPVRLMMGCPYCGKEVSILGQFCGECGKPIQEAIKEHIVEERKGEV